MSRKVFNSHIYLYKAFYKRKGYGVTYVQRNKPHHLNNC